MKAGNGTIIAVASGNLQFGSTDDSGKRAGNSKRNQGKNAGLIQSGAIIEREIKILLYIIVIRSFPVVYLKYNKIGFSFRNKFKELEQLLKFCHNSNIDNLKNLGPF